jgi:hypothetical protein
MTWGEHPAPLGGHFVHCWDYVGLLDNIRVDSGSGGGTRAVRSAMMLDVGFIMGVLLVALLRRGVVARAVGTNVDHCAIACALDNAWQLGLAGCPDVVHAEYFYFILMSIVSHIFPSLVLSEGEEEVNHDDKVNMNHDAKDVAAPAATNNNDKDNNDTIMLPKVKLAAATAATKIAAKKPKKDDEIMHLSTPKLPKI